MVGVFADNSMTLYMTIICSLDTVPAKFLLFWVIVLWYYIRLLHGNALTGQLADVFQNLGR